MAPHEQELGISHGYAHTWRGSSEISVNHGSHGDELNWTKWLQLN